MLALLGFYLFKRSFEKHLFLDKRNGKVHHHTKAEHQNYCVHRKCYGMGAVQDIENTVIAEVDDKRIDGIIAGFAKPHKDVVNNGAARIRNIKRNELYNDTENLAGVFKPLCIAEERYPCGNGNRPKYRACSGNKVIVEL